ncbi:MAG: TVP38/TMEM64 family protein [Clostridia bacterium]|nr:TVP38/TMEM64 family protein [Clostridia bacterium]
MSRQPSSITRRRVLALCSLAAVLALFTWLTVFLWKRFAAFGDDPAAFKAFVEGYGWKSRLVALGIQMLQVVVSFVPGEVVEVGMGYAFGAIEGTLLCLAGVALASVPIFLLVKSVGVKAVELFISRDKIDSLRFINSEKRLKRLVFLLYFIPGTPKDLFTYFVGLTRLRLHEFLVITLIARIPSVISSTVGGNLIQKENYIGAVLLFVVTGAVSLGGMVLYNRLKERKSRSKP